MKRDPKQIKPGCRLYVHSSFFIEHGEDDVCGGIATVEEITYKPIPKNPINDWFVTFKGLNASYNLMLLLKNQSQLRKEYKGQKAHQCPNTV